MALIVPPGFAQVTMQYANASGLGSKLAFTFGVGRAPSADLADDIKVWWDIDLQPVTSQHYLLELIKLRSDVGEADLVVNETGAVSGATMPPNVAALVQKRTGLAGRANRGRMYLPGVLPEDTVDNGGTISTVQRDGLQVVMEHLLDMADTNWGGVQLFHNGSSDPTTVTSLPVLATVATQRRRVRK